MAALFLGVHPKHGAKAHGLAQDLCFVAALFVDHFIEVFETGVLALVGIPVQQCQPQIDPFSMFQPAQIGAGGIVKADFGAVVGVRAPADIVQQTGGLDQSFALRRGRFVERQDKVEQRLAEPRRPRVFGFGKAAGFDQRITVT